MKKALSVTMVIVLLFSLGFLAFAEDVTADVADNPKRTECLEVAEGDTMNTNYGTVDLNSGAIITNAEYEPLTDTECANGFIWENGTTGQVENNIGQVDTNHGAINNNTGLVLENEKDGTITLNDGIVYGNEGTIDTNNQFAPDGGGYPKKGYVADNTGLVNVNNGVVVLNEGTVNVNNGSVSNNEGTVDINDGAIYFNGGTVNVNNWSVSNNVAEVARNYDYVNLAGADATVTENHGYVVNGECNDQGVTTYKQNSIVYSVNYHDGGKELGYYNLNESLTDGTPVVPVPVASSEDFGISKFGHKAKWTAYDSDGTSADLYPGDTYGVLYYVNFVLGWDKTINADICFEDENGVFEGRSFLLNQPLENFQNVSCNAAYLEKGVDYTVEAENGMTRVKLTDKFFEKNGDGPIAVAPLFAGAIFYLYAVNR